MITVLVLDLKFGVHSSPFHVSRGFLIRLTLLKLLPCNDLIWILICCIMTTFTYEDSDMGMINVENLYAMAYDFYLQKRELKISLKNVLDGE